MKYKIEFNYRYGKDYVYCTMKMSGLYSHLILMVNPYVLLQRLIYYLLENANNANAIKIGKFKIAHGD